MTTSVEASNDAVVVWSNQEHFAAADRGLFYGDGLFETIRLVNGQPRFLSRHLNRLRQSADAFQLPLPEGIESEITRGLVESSATTGVIKLVVSRQATSRGYAPDLSAGSNLLVLIYPDQPATTGPQHTEVTLGLCSTRLARQPVLAGHKHLNRLEQVCARREWQDPAIADGVMLDTRGWVVETTSSNLFLCLDSKWVTPDLSHCGVAGVMRGWVLEEARRLGEVISVGHVTRDDLMNAESMFISNAVTGVRGVSRYLDGLSFSADAERGCCYVTSGLVERLSERLHQLSEPGG